jgi:hypothetical protein
MGKEAACEVRFAGRSSEGKAHLEPSELRFSGEFRLKIPFDEVRQVAARDGKPGGLPRQRFVLNRDIHGGSSAK